MKNILELLIAVFAGLLLVISLPFLLINDVTEIVDARAHYL